MLFLDVEEQTSGSDSETELDSHDWILNCKHIKVNIMLRLLLAMLCWFYEPNNLGIIPFASKLQRKIFCPFFSQATKHTVFQLLISCDIG